MKKKNSGINITVSTGIFKNILKLYFFFLLLRKDYSSCKKMYGTKAEETVPLTQRNQNVPPLQRVKRIRAEDFRSAVRSWNKTDTASVFVRKETPQNRLKSSGYNPAKYLVTYISRYRTGRVPIVIYFGQIVIIFYKE
jgi:hypothetical protein